MNIHWNRFAQTFLSKIPICWTNLPKHFYQKYQFAETNLPKYFRRNPNLLKPICPNIFTKSTNLLKPIRPNIFTKFAEILICRNPNLPKSCMCNISPWCWSRETRREAREIKWPQLLKTINIVHKPKRKQRSPRVVLHCVVQAQLSTITRNSTRCMKIPRDLVKVKRRRTVA